MLEFRRLGDAEAQNVSSRIHDYWIEIYSGDIVSGADGIDNIFDREETPDKVVERMRSGTVFEDVVDHRDTVGLIAYRPVAPTLYIDKLYLDGTERGHHLGDRILEHMFDVGRRAGCTKAELVVSTSNPHAIKFYERNGFTIESEEEVPDGFGNNGYRYHMSLKFRIRRRTDCSTATELFITLQNSSCEELL